MDIIILTINIIKNQDTLVRFALVVLTALYGLFALIVAIQIKNLNKIINQIEFSPIFIFLGFLHVSAALALFLLAVLSL